MHPKPENPEALAERAAADRHRPRYHVTAPGGWLNDPNGVGFHDGVYHLFYQYNPYGAFHHGIHWGHVTSPDLVRWSDEPIALVPGPGPDSHGCWSGALVEDAGIPTILYTGHDGTRQLPCVATGSPDLRSWTKDPGNPVIASTPPGVAVTEFRDHCLWWEGGRWHQLIGAGIAGQGGSVLHYISDDLRAWTFDGPMLIGDSGRDPQTGSVWECPDLFTVDGASGTQVLVFSAWDEGVTMHAMYRLVRRVGNGLEPLALAFLDHGRRYFYAPQSFTAPDGRRIMFGWVQEGREEAECITAGWSGAMSVPREVSLVEGRLHCIPAGEVALLREGPPLVLAPSRLTDSPVRTATGDVADVEVGVMLERHGWAEISLREASDRSERTTLTLTRSSDGAGWMSLDRTASSLAPCDTHLLEGDFPVGEDGAVELRVLLDASVIEVYANGQPLTARVYPTRADSVGVALTGRGAVLSGFRRWEMGAAFHGHRSPPDREQSVDGRDSP